MRLQLAGLAALALSGATLGCVPADHGRTEVITKDVEKSNAEVVRAEFEIGAGKLQLHGGAAKLMEAAFTVNPPELAPDVRYNTSGFRGELFVGQVRKQMQLQSRMRNEWDVRLAEDVPLDVIVRGGAGEMKLELGSLALRGVEVHLGAGQCDLDLRGKPRKSYTATIQGGVGEARIWLPHDAAVTAEARGGIGEIKVTGLRREGGAWVSERYGKGQPEIHLDVRGGIGSIRIFGE